MICSARSDPDPRAAFLGWIDFFFRDLSESQTEYLATYIKWIYNDNKGYFTHWGIHKCKFNTEFSTEDEFAKIFAVLWIPLDKWMESALLDGHFQLPTLTDIHRGEDCQRQNLFLSKVFLLYRISCAITPLDTIYNLGDTIGFGLKQSVFRVDLSYVKIIQLHSLRPGLKQML
jgi:hypothetical protein